LELLKEKKKLEKTMKPLGKNRETYIKEIPNPKIAIREVIDLFG